MSRKTKSQIQTIEAAFATVTITSETTFDITDGDTLFSGYFIPDTQLLAESEIPKILDRSDWIEDDITAAVKAMNEEAA